MTTTSIGVGFGLILLTSLAVGLVLLVVLPGRHRGLRIGIAVGLLAFAGLAALVVGRTEVRRSTLLAEEREAVRRVHAVAPLPPVAQSTPTPVLPVVVPTQPTPMPPLPPTPGDGGEIVIEGLAIPAAATEAPVNGDEGKARIIIAESLAAQPEELANSLVQYFDRLVRSPAPPVEQELQALRDQLRKISATQRREVAQRVAALQESIVEKVHIATSQSVSVDPLQRTRAVSIDPERIRELAISAAARVPAGPQLATWQKIVGTIVVLIIAAAILKVATRRHSGVRYL